MRQKIKKENKKLNKRVNQSNTLRFAFLPYRLVEVSITKCRHWLILPDCHIKYEIKFGIV